jgi:ApaG protein
LAGTKPDTAEVKRSASSDTITHGIRVQAAAQYLPSESNPDDRQYIYAYRIVLTNEGTQRARLKSRHWIILDADNQREDVRGPGVVGKTPDLAPGERFEYMSGCPLRTSWGTMEGSYIFEREGGEQFEAMIGRFFLVPTAPKIASQVK